MATPILDIITQGTFAARPAASAAVEYYVTTGTNAGKRYWSNGTTWFEQAPEAGGGGVTDANYLVGTAHAGLSTEIVVGATPGGELGGTWGSPTVDATHSGSTHAAAQAAAEATAAGALSTHAGAADPHAVYQLESAMPASASQAEMEAGTEAGLRQVSPLRVAQAIAALAGGGGGLDSIGDGAATVTPVTDLIVPPHSLSGTTPNAEIAWDRLHTVAASGATETLDLADGDTFDVTLTADCTITLAGATSGRSSTMTVVTRQDGTGGRDITWPGSVDWLVTPAPDTTPLAVNVYVLWSFDGGTSWGGTLVGAGGGGGGSVATDTIWDAAGDLVQGTGANTAAKLSAGTAGHVLTSGGAGVAASWAAPAGGGGALVSASYKRTGGDYTTSSASFTNVDGTNMVLNLTTGAHRVMVGFAGTLIPSASGQIAALDVAVDGTRIGGDRGFVVAQNNVNNDGSFVVLTDVLTAGAHTFALMWLSSSGTATIPGGSSTNPAAQFWAVEQAS